MSEELPGESRLTCINCGFEAPVGGSWEEVSHSQLGTLTQCPGCRSTDVHKVQ